MKPLNGRTAKSAPDELHGLARLGAPVVRAALERLGDLTASQIQQEVARL